MEHEARKKLEEIMKVDVQLSGLVIDFEFPYLSASPGIFCIYNYVMKPLIFSNKLLMLLLKKKRASL